MKKTQNFEQAMARLEEISQLLESGEISLEDSIKLYEEGVKLIDLCQKRLNEAEKKILILSRNKEGDFESSALNSQSTDESD
jgi:exodeoxyribonuclease VII small subunit